MVVDGEVSVVAGVAGKVVTGIVVAGTVVDVVVEVVVVGVVAMMWRS